MSARDKFHEVVKIALQKESWLITHDPYPLQADTFDLAIDLGAKELAEIIFDIEHNHYQLVYIGQLYNKRVYLNQYIFILLITKIIKLRSKIMVYKLLL